jgi:hypothetical protein
MMWSEIVKGRATAAEVDNFPKRFIFMPGRHHKTLIRWRKVRACSEKCQVDGVMPSGTLVTCADSVSTTLSDDVPAESISLIIADARINHDEQQDKLLPIKRTRK